MKTTADSHYRHDEKRELTPEELVKAKTACEFVINLTKAISRSGYYESSHPISQEVKLGLYNSFKGALGSSSEIMLTCHEEGGKIDIHISGILDEPFNIRRLTREGTSELFVPKLKDYFERKSLNSFAIKKHITSEHFESFIDVMSEPVTDFTDDSKLGEYLTKALIDSDISEVSTVFKNDAVLLEGKLPWHVSIILRRLAKDLKVIPMFRFTSDDKIKVIKKQIIDDIIRPLRNTDLIRDLIVNCDIIVSHIAHLEYGELEQMIINSLPANIIVPVSKAVFEIYKAINDDLQPDQHDSTLQQRHLYLGAMLGMAAKRIVSEQLQDATDLLEQLYEHKIIHFDILPEKLRFDMETRKSANDVISQIDIYMDKTIKVSSGEDLEAIVIVFRRIIPELIRRREWLVIDQIVKAIFDVSSRKEISLNKPELLSNLPDSIFEGSDAKLAQAYIHAELAAQHQMDEILMKLTSMCIKVLSAVFAECKDPDVLKAAIHLLSKRGELARQWSIKILDDPNQNLSMLNTALLIIIHVGHGYDINMVKKYAKHANPSIRTKVLDATVKLNKKDAEVLIIEALNDEDEKVRDHAAALIKHESSLSEEFINMLCQFIKTELLQKKNMTIYEARRLAGLIMAIGKLPDYFRKEPIEDEILGITLDLLKGRIGLFKLIKADPKKEQLELIYACISTLGKIGGLKSRTFLNTLERGNTMLSKIAYETIEELDKKLV